MKSVHMAFYCCLFVCTIAEQTNAQSYKKIHKEAIVIDTHNDILSKLLEKGYMFDEDLTGKTHSDLGRMFRGGIDIQVFSVWCDGLKQNPYTFANREIDTLYAVVGRHPDKMILVKTPTDLTESVNEKKLGCMLGVEGGHMIENDLSKLDTLYRRGVRYVTLTWNNSTLWATSAMEETHDSLLNQSKG
ncbi:MAG: dipeptidase, partial [Ginsengibacter sp.]